MKNLLYIVIIIILLGVIMNSCNKQKDPFGNNSPYNVTNEVQEPGMGL